MSHPSAFITLFCHSSTGTTSTTTARATSHLHANLFTAHVPSVHFMARVFCVAWIFKQDERKARRISSDPYIAKRAEFLKLTLEFAPGAIVAQFSNVNSRHLAPKCRYFAQNLNKKIVICNEHEAEQKSRLKRDIPGSFAIHTKNPG